MQTNIWTVLYIWTKRHRVLLLGPESKHRFQIKTFSFVLIFIQCWITVKKLIKIMTRSLKKIHPRTTPKPHLRLHKSLHIFLIYDGLIRQTHNHRQVETCRKSQWTRCYADIRRSTHLDMAPKSVVAVKLTHFSIAGLFHFSINENVPGEQGHFSTHVDPIHDLSDVMILRLPWRDNTSGISVTGYDNVNYSRKKKKKWKGSIASCELVTNVHYNV